MTIVAASTGAVSAAATAEADEVLRAAHGTLAGRSDPYPLYARIREIAPLYRSGLDGLWYASTYEDCKALLVDPRVGMGPLRPRFGVSLPTVAGLNRTGAASMLLTNPPEHTRLRGMVNKAFTPRRTEGLRDRIRELAEPMVAGLAGGAADLMTAVARPLPVTVIGELIGVPAAEHEPVRAAWNASVAASAHGSGPDEVEAGRRADDFLDAYFADLTARRRAAPAEDMLSALVAARDEDGTLAEDELLATLRLLFLAGFVTTTNLIGNGLLALLRHPAQQERLWAEPALVSNAVEEMLRYDSVVQFTRRVAVEPIERAGAVIEAGDDIVTLPGAANRDPARFPDPDTFDIARTDNAPLSFGWGIHHCIGAPLARLEAQVVLQLLIETFDHLGLADDMQPSPRTDWFIRGLDALPVHAVPRS